MPTHHCVTGSMRHIYTYNDHDISEEMLLGVGRGNGAGRRMTRPPYSRK
ncbi:MAG: hypothetical protein H5T64_07100 [Chloroflexi bacterium]|nr:hypothetical protein [Chloroflexota bacterium]